MATYQLSLDEADRQRMCPLRSRSFSRATSSCKSTGKKLESEIDELGYDIAYDGSLRWNTSGNLATELAAFDESARDMRQSLQSLTGTQWHKFGDGCS